jgi:hypothetical protein
MTSFGIAVSVNERRLHDMLQSIYKARFVLFGCLLSLLSVAFFCVKLGTESDNSMFSLLLPASVMLFACKCRSFIG